MPTPQRGLSAASARDNPDTVPRLDPATAARVAGSRVKQEEVLGGADFADVINRGPPAGYRVGALGDVVSSPAMRSEELAALSGDIRPIDLGAVQLNC